MMNIEQGLMIYEVWFLFKSVSALRNTESNIGSVSLPVKVFCWLG